MSSEESANYSDALSDYSLSGNATPVPSSSSSDDAPQLRPKQTRRAGSSIFFRSETLFLVLLFAIIALLLPTFFFFASSKPSAGEESSDAGEARKSPLKALLPYIPAVSTLIRLSFSAFYLLLRPFIATLSLILAILAPVFIAANILFTVLILIPSRMVIGLVRFFYPVYLLCGTACIFGAIIGLGGRFLVKGSRLMLVGIYDDAGVRGSKGQR